MPRTFLQGLVTFTVLIGLGFGLSGCGGSSNDQLWEGAASFAVPHQHMLASADASPEARQGAHGAAARRISQLLDEHPDADERLRRLLSDLRDNEQQLANGAVSRSEAEALRERNADLWASIERRELPADYR